MATPIRMLILADQPADAEPTRSMPCGTPSSPLSTLLNLDQHPEWFHNIDPLAIAPQPHYQNRGDFVAFGKHQSPGLRSDVLGQDHAREKIAHADHAHNRFGLYDLQRFEGGDKPALVEMRLLEHLGNGPLI